MAYSCPGPHSRTVDFHLISLKKQMLLLCDITRPLESIRKYYAVLRVFPASFPGKLSACTKTDVANGQPLQ